MKELHFKEHILVLEGVTGFLCAIDASNGAYCTSESSTVSIRQVYAVCLCGTSSPSWQINLVQIPQTARDFSMCLLDPLLVHRSTPRRGKNFHNSRWFVCLPPLARPTAQIIKKKQTVHSYRTLHVSPGSSFIELKLLNICATNHGYFLS